MFFLGTILSSYGRADSKLCKRVCVIVLRLHIIQYHIVKMRLHVTGAVYMILSYVQWHISNLPIIQNGSCTLKAVCEFQLSVLDLRVTKRLVRGVTCPVLGDQVVQEGHINRVRDITHTSRNLKIVQSCTHH